MRYRGRERDAIMEHGVRAFVLRGHRHDERIRNFLAALPHVEHFLRTHQKAFLAKVYQGGRVEMWLQYEEWRRSVGLGPNPEGDD
jgi:hypothetical protein